VFISQLLKIRRQCLPCRKKQPTAHLLQIDGDFEKEMKLKICELGRNPVPFSILFPDCHNSK